MSTFSSRLKELLEIKGITQAELSRISGVSKSSLSHYLKGDWNAKQDTIYAIATATMVSEAWLMGYDDVQMDRAPAGAPDGLQAMPKTYTVPLLGAIACGKPILAEENTEGAVEVPDFVRCDFALRCKGDSMIGAGIQDGDAVYIREQPDVEDGEIAAVLIDDEATLKRVYKIPGRVQLRPENAAYSVMEYAGEELAEIRILGKAVGYTHLF